MAAYYVPIGPLAMFRVKRSMDGTLGHKSFNFGSYTKIEHGINTFKLRQEPLPSTSRMTKPEQLRQNHLPLLGRRAVSIAKEPIHSKNVHLSRILSVLKQIN